MNIFVKLFLKIEIVKKSKFERIKKKKGYILLFLSFLLKESVVKILFFFIRNSSYLVDPASSHMLVLKIKPCMSKYKHLYCETANGSLYQL